MKSAPLYPLLACLSIALALVPARAQDEGTVLARVEAVDRVDRLGLPVYAHLLDARGQAYVLVVATEAELEQAGWPFTVLAANPDRAALSLAIERLPGALEQARVRVPVLYDDGVRLIITPTPEQAAALMAQGVAVIRINTPLTWPAVPEAAAAALLARRAVEASATVSNLMARIQQEAVSNLVCEMDGETPAVIGGTTNIIETRHTDSGDPIRLADQYVTERLQASGLLVTNQWWTNSGYSGNNIVGIKPGTTRSNEIIVVTAHIDNMPSGARAPGADDNASGCAGVMLAADVFRDCPTERTIHFVAFGGEEQGLLGSAWYTLALENAGETNVTVFNMDMIGYSSISNNGRLSLHTRLTNDPGYAADMAVASTFESVVATYGLGQRLNVNIAADAESASDHFSFWTHGYPGILAIEYDFGFNPHYHTTQDVVAAMNFSYCTDYIRAAVGTVAHLAGVPPPPAAPTDVTATAGAFTDKIRVTWAAVTNATGYEIWRHTADSAADAARLATAAASPYDDATATVGTTYYYWLRATNALAAGPFSASAFGYRASTVVAAPTHVTASDGTYTDRVELAWDAVTGATGYEIWRSATDDPAAAARLISLLTTTTPPARQSYDDISTAAGATNYYWIRATAGAAASAFSTPSARGSRAAPGVLTAPTSVMASTTYADKVRLLWSAVAGATGYEVWRGTAADAQQAAKLAEVAEPGGDDISAARGTTYYYWIKARNATQTSAFSAPAAGRVTDTTTIGPVIQVNGNEGSGVILQRGDTLSVQIALFTGTTPAADWWLIVVTSSGMYAYNATRGEWNYCADLASVRPAYQGSLFEFSAPYDVLSMTTAALTAGTYSFYFGVDTLMNGVLDNPPYLFYSGVTLTLAP